jgi:hypothetical protein
VARFAPAAMSNGKIVRATAFFDGIAFDNFW